MGSEFHSDPFVWFSGLSDLEFGAWVGSEFYTDPMVRHPGPKVATPF